MAHFPHHHWWSFKILSKSPLSAAAILKVDFGSSVQNIVYRSWLFYESMSVYSAGCCRWWWWWWWWWMMIVIFYQIIESLEFQLDFNWIFFEIWFFSIFSIFFGFFSISIGFQLDFFGFQLDFNWIFSWALAKRQAWEKKQKKIEKNQKPNPKFFFIFLILLGSIPNLIELKSKKIRTKSKKMRKIKKIGSSS